MALRTNLLQTHGKIQKEKNVQVELDTLSPPGAMASGSVIFSDGELNSWALDQYGRLNCTYYKPSKEEIHEFQKKLNSALREKGF